MVPQAVERDTEDPLDGGRVRGMDLGDPADHPHDVVDRSIKSVRVGKCRYSVPMPTPARRAMSSSEAEVSRSVNASRAAAISLS